MLCYDILLQNFISIRSVDFARKWNKHSQIDLADDATTRVLVKINKHTIRRTTKLLFTCRGQSPKPALKIYFTFSLINLKFYTNIIKL